MATAPLVNTIGEDTPEVVLGADDAKVIGVAPFAGTVTGVTYIPKSAITGADTNTRKVEVYNRKTGSGTTLVAGIQYNAGVNAAADTENAVTLSATPANLVVAEGDVLEFVSTHIGTGLADPGGHVIVTVSRS